MRQITFGDFLPPETLALPADLASIVPNIGPLQLDYPPTTVTPPLVNPGLKTPTWLLPGMSAQVGPLVNRAAGLPSTITLPAPAAAKSTISTPVLLFAAAVVAFAIMQS